MSERDPEQIPSPSDRATFVEGSARTVLDATRALMRDLDLTTVFGNPGSTEESFLKDWPADFTYVLGLQEASVLGMADGWSRVMHRPALVNLHTSVGVGNAMGNLVNAWYDKSPLIVLAGQQTREMVATEPLLTDIEAITLPRPYVKFSHEPMRAEDVPGALMHAYAAALQPPSGPVFLSVPLDDWGKPEGRPTVARQVPLRLSASAEGLRSLAEVLQGARAPALVVGDGLRRARGWNDAITFAERSRCAVFSAPFDPGAFPEDHALYQGMLPPSIARIRQALLPFDVVLVVGTPLFRYYPYVEGDYMPEGVQVFHIVDDAAESARAPIGTPILADPADALRALTTLLQPTEREPPASREPPATPAPSSPMTADHLLHALSQSRPPRAVLAFEAPTAFPAVQRFWPVTEPDAFFFLAGGGLGYGLPAAVGIALAERQLGRHRPVVALIGDGSLHYSIQALYTAAALNLPIVVVVPDNGGYAVLKQFALAEGNAGIPGLDLAGIDAVSIARGYGCSATRADTPSDVQQAFDEALRRRGPTVIVSAVVTDLGKLL